MELSKQVKKLLQDMIAMAQEKRHEYVTPEHFLYLSCDDKRFCACLRELGADPEALKKDLEDYFDTEIDRIPEDAADDVPELSHGLQLMLEHAALQAHTSGRSEISYLHIFRSMMQLKESYALYLIAKQGIEPDALFLCLHREMSDDTSGTDETATVQTGGQAASGKEDWRQYVTCLNDLVMRDDIVPLIGRETELRRLMLVLCRKEKNNPMLIGEAGVGKTAIAYGFVRRIEMGQVPEILKDAKVYMIDMGSMIAGTQYRGDFEKRMESVLKGIAQEEKPIIYLDEIHNIVGAGAVGNGTLDASNILKPYMTDGRIRFIGSTTYDEYKKSIAKNHSLVRRFQNIDVEEPDPEATQRILEGLVPYYEAHHGVRYPQEVLRSIVELSDKYLTEAFRPDKAIDLMDEAGAVLHLDGKKGADVTVELVQQVLTEFLKIPPERVAEDEHAQLKVLPDKIKAQVFGQEEAIDAVCRAIRLSRAGLNEEQKPVASLLFVGPTGVGKTEIARVLADVMNIPLIRFDMSEYMEKHAVAKFLGAPAGYVGYEEGGRLTDVIRKKPHSVLLLDEIEKAHPDIMNVLLQIMDYATVTDSQGVKADFRNVILIMTSNAGASDLVRSMIGFGGTSTNTGAVDAAVKRLFTPEFRNRLTDIITFRALSDEMAVKIVDKQLRQIEEKVEAKGRSILFSDEVREYIKENGISAEYGARKIQRVIDREIKPLLADCLLDDAAEDAQVIRVELSDGKIRLS